MIKKEYIKNILIEHTNYVEVPENFFEYICSDLFGDKSKIAAEVCMNMLNISSFRTSKYNTNITFKNIIYI